jgi:hypothetical protein
MFAFDARISFTRSTLFWLTACSRFILLLSILKEITLNSIYLQKKGEKLCGEFFQIFFDR